MSTFGEYTSDLKKKKKKETEKKQTFGEYTESVVGRSSEKEEIRTASPKDDIGPVKSSSSLTLKDAREASKARKKGFAAEEADENEERSWFKKSNEFDDGYQFGDIYKTVSASSTDLGNDVVAGILGIGEKAVDAGAYLVGGVGGLLGADEFADKTKDFIAKDLYDEEEIANNFNLTGSPITALIHKLIGVDTEEDSVFGEKTDSLAQSGGQLVGTMALQSVGVPWFVTSGVTSFGSETESAFNEDASYLEAGASGLISAGAEILTEKLFGGSGLGEKGLINLEPLTKGISSKVVKALADFGLDMAAEGMEEVFSSVFSRLGSALYKEENVADLLWSEEAFDEYLESFIGGMALGGVANTGKTVSSVKTGRDYRTELTDNEQKVLDKVYEEALNDAQKDGKELPKKQKEKLYDELSTKLKKGGIDTDTIESIFGGESYEAYKSILEKEQPLRDEIDSINNNKTLNDEQKKTLIDSVNAKLEALAKDTNKAQVRADLDSFMKSQLIRKDGKQTDGYLLESYNEKARGSQNFEVDLSKYKGKEKEILQRFMEKGQLNNKRSTHEFWEYAARVGAEKNLDITTTTTEEILEMETKKHGKAYVEKHFKGKTPNAYIMDDGTLGINIKSPQARRFLLGHEVGHTLEKTKYYKELQDLLFAYAESKEGIEAFKARANEVKSLYKGIKGAKANKELTADLIGQYIYDDADFVYHLSTKNKNLFQKIWDEVKYLYKMATAGSQEQRDLERIKRTFEKAYRESVKGENKAQGKTDYSLSIKHTDGSVEELADARDLTNERAIEYLNQAKSGVLQWDAYIPVRKDTPQVIIDTLEQVNEDISNNSLVMQVRKAQKAMSTENPGARGGKHGNNVRSHNLSAEEIVEIVNKLDEPTTIVYQTNRKDQNGKRLPNNVAVFVEYGTQGSESVAVIEFDSSINSEFVGKEFGDTSYHTVVTIFEPDVERDGVPYDYAEELLSNPNNYELEITRRQSVESAIGKKRPNTSNELPSDGIISQNSEKSSGNSTFSLSAEQKEYFKDSVVRDEDGNLKVMYHGTSKGGYTVFDTFGSNYGLFGQGSYFTDNKDIAESYTKKGKGNNPQIYESYLNIKNPMDMDADADIKAWLKAVPDADFSNCVTNEDCYRAMEEYLMDEEYSKWEAAEFATDSIMGMGYDGITHIGGGRVNADSTRHRVYIAFNPEQIKNIDNLKPTDNPDIRYSLSAEDKAPIQFKDDVPMSDSLLDVAPVREDIAKNATTTKNNVPIVDEADILPNSPNLYDLYREQRGLEKQISEAVESNDIDTLNSLMPTYEALLERIKTMETEQDTLNKESLASLDDADAPPEMEAPYIEPTETIDPFDDRDEKDVGSPKVKAYMYENPEVKPFFQAEANLLLGELENDTIKGERMYIETPDGRLGEYGSDSYGYWTGVKAQKTESIRYLHDTLGISYGKIEAGLKDIIEDHGEENNAVSKRIEFELNNRLLYGYTDGAGVNVPANQDYINLLKEKQITEYGQEAFNRLFGSDDMSPVKESNASESIKPRPKKLTGEEAQWAKNKMSRADKVSEESKSYYESRKASQIEGQQTMFAEDKIAKIVDADPEDAKKKRGVWSYIKEKVLDKGMVFENLSKKTKNRELEAKWNSIRYAKQNAQNFMVEGGDGVKSLDSIKKAVEKTGKADDFENYMYHLHNVDRMSLEGKVSDKLKKLRKPFANLNDAQIEVIAKEWIRKKTLEEAANRIRQAREYLELAKIKNKPVFGYDITAEKSRELIKQYESANPEFKEFAQDVYRYNEYLRKMLVDNGVISQETADLWAEMYPHYVPIHRKGKNGAGVNVPLDTGRTGVNAPIKRATGGNSDFYHLFNTMAERTEQTFMSVAKNRFGVELKNTLGTTISKETAGVDAIIEGVEKHEQLLKKGENGENPTFTVFENGERVEFEITEEMYDALRPAEGALTYTNKPANAISKVMKAILTEYNLVFAAKNVLKDTQDVLLNSKHPLKTYRNYPKAIASILTKGEWNKEYLKHSGAQNTYFDNQKTYYDSESQTFAKEKRKFVKAIGFPLNLVSTINNIIERVPRLAEYIASREAGESVDVSMLDAARVTTNFSAGGDLTKALNRNGFTFLNASVQGAVQQVRNVREAKMNGLKGWVQLAAKVMAAGLPAILLNHLLWEDDEEYEELSDYVKQNYYVVAKTEDGRFVRIPKGRASAVIQDAFAQMEHLITGDDEADLKSFLDLAVSNLAPNDPLNNNIIAPITQTISNKTWYGEDLVPTRLQDVPKAEQFDESTDAISKWLGEKMNVSPMKINYLLEQYSGGIGDVFLPMLTPEAESGDNSFGGNLIAPWKDTFSTDSVMNNQNVSDFYDTMDELTTNAKASTATDEDVLKYQYFNSVSSELSELYQQKREIQSGDLPDSLKYAKVRWIQEKINSLAKESLNAYNDVNIDNTYATVGDRHYRWYEPGEDSDAEAGWQKITDKQLEKQNKVTKKLNITPSAYWSNKAEYDYAYKYPEKYKFLNENGVSYADYDNGSDDFKEAYSWAYENPEKFTMSKAVASDVVTYRQYASALYDIKADKDENGKSISGSRKEKVIDYINDLNADYGEKIILFKSEYPSDDTYNYEIIDYLNNRDDLSYEDMATILKELGFTVSSDGTVTWD